MKPVTRWGLRWLSRNSLDGEHTHLIFDGDRMPALFRTRAEARAYAAETFGYIKRRPDLRREPHGWTVPQPIRVTIAARDSDASLAEDPKGLSREAVAARAEGIAQPLPEERGMTNTDTTLKPCPFCGGEARVARHYATAQVNYWAVDCICYPCDIQGPCAQTEAEAIAAWNQRTKPAVPDVRDTFVAGYRAAHFDPTAYDIEAAALEAWEDRIAALRAGDTDAG